MMLWISAMIAAADQLVKAAVRRVPEGTVFFQANPLFELTHCTNRGAAFSIFSGQTLWIAGVSAMLLIAIVLYTQRCMHLTRTARIGLAGVIGGGVGNLIDRLVFSGVTDYIRLICIDFPVFNLADIAITISVAVLMILIVTGRFEIVQEHFDGSEH